VQSDAHSALTHTNPFSYVPGSEALNGDEFDDLALLSGKTRQYLLSVDERVLVAILRRRKTIGVVVYVNKLAKSPSAQMIDHLVVGDSPQPRLERLVLIPGVALKVHRQKCILHNVFAIFHVQTCP
jgi:hypothetical protein